MALLNDVAALIPTLCGHAVVTRADDDAAASNEIQARMLVMKDAEIRAVLHEAAAVERQVALLRQLATGIVAARSQRVFGHGGLAAKEGHRSAVSLVQEVMGVSQAEAARQVRVAEALVDAKGAAATPDDVGVEGAGAGRDAGAGGDAGTGEQAAVAEPWYQPLCDALRSEALSAAQFDAIKNGLGEPPVAGEGSAAFEAGAVDAETLDAATPDVETLDAQAVQEAWRTAAGVLIDEARVRTVGDLAAAARRMRDQLDPAGAERRFRQRYEARSFRMYQTEAGATRVSWTLDDETALFMASVKDAALRPRLGGPRFVDSAEIARARSLSADDRTNDQLLNDLMVDIFRAGVLADAKSVFGTRQAGVRLVQIIDDEGVRDATAHSEDHLFTVPGAVADRRLCEAGSTHITVTANGDPLNLGRTARMFSAAQKVALAVRDGGCRWPHCDRPASYTEAHHIDPWQHGGKTDIDRGILLCQYHHLHLHDERGHISRTGKEEFILHRPGHEPQALKTRAPLKYAWQRVRLPSPRFRPATRGATAA